MQKRLFALIGLALLLTDRPALARTPLPAFLTLGAEIEPPRGFVEMCSKLKSVCDNFRVESAADKSDGSSSNPEPADVPSITLPGAPWPAFKPTGAILDNQRLAAMDDGIKAIADAPYPAPPRPIPDLSLNFGQSMSSVVSPSGTCLLAAAGADSATLPWITPQPEVWSLLPALHANNLAQTKPCHSHVSESGMDVITGAPQNTVMTLQNASLTLPGLIIETATAAPVPPDSETRNSNPLEILARVNRHVNSHVRQQSDIATYGVGELWRPSGDGPRAVGDCEDLAIEKRLQLIAAHFPPENLFFAVVYGTNIGLHTVLIARLDSGDVVLDSRTPHIEPWTRAGYKWLAIEKPGKPEVWLRSS